MDKKMRKKGGCDANERMAAAAREKRRTLRSSRGGRVPSGGTRGTGKEDCLYVGQLLDRVEGNTEHRPETEPNGAWHYRQNFLIGFCRTENIYTLAYVA